MTLRTRTLALVTAVAFGIAAPASAAFISYNLTGTWSGKVTCKVLVGGVKQKTVATPVMRISQVGVNFGVELDFGTGTDFFAGLANPDTKKPEEKGEAALLRCGSTELPGELGGAELVRLKVKTKASKGTGGLSGQSFFSAPSPAPNHGTCKWKWKRTDTVDPALPTECITTLQARGAR